MMRRLIAATVTLSLSLNSAAWAESTVNPAIPATNGPLLSAPIRENFAAAATDINNILGMYAGTTAPSLPTIGQWWLNKTTTPWVAEWWDGGAWIQFGTFNPSTHQFIGYYGATLMGALAALSFDSNFANTGGNLALHTIASGDLLGNCTGSTAEPGACSLAALIAEAGGIATSELQAGAVTYSVLQNVAAHSIPANPTGAAASAQDVGAATARGSTLLNIDAVTPHGDSVYAILATDRTVFTSAALTAPRVWTLPTAASVNPGQMLTVADAAGGVTGTNTLSVARNGSDTIDGGTASVLFSAAYTGVILESDGVSNWKVTSRVAPFTAPSHQWVSSFSPETGFGASQPAASDLSNGTTGTGAVVLATGTAATATAANGLNSATTTVVVNAATAPTSGQVLTATSGTAANWATPGSAPPSGAAGGDLGGSYPNPTVTNPAHLSGTAAGLTAGAATLATTATAANGLNSATTTVVVNAATAPTSGQVLTATSGTAANWATPASGAAGANPTATVGASAVNGSASTFMRSDAAPPLANTAVTAGSYTSTNLTVDAQGRITAAANGGGGSGPTLLTTLTASNSASLTDTTHLTATYKSYEFLFFNLLPASAGTSINLFVSTNGGSTYDTTSTNYYTYYSAYDAVNGGALIANTSGMAAYNNNPQTSLYGISGKTTIYDPASSNVKLFEYRMIWAYPNVSVSARTNYAAGGGSYTGSTSAINAIEIIAGTGNLTSGYVEIWGIP